MTININYFRVSFNNPVEFLLLYRQVFKSGDYFFATGNKQPFIVDCGAHIGLSVLYFKKIYPEARILAFEPDPGVFKLLQRNIVQNNLKGVHCINAAVSDKKGHMAYFRSSGLLGWSWGSSGEKGKFLSRYSYRQTRVDAVTLSSFINSPVDFMKMDIEGMEGKVLSEAKAKLKLVKKIVTEYHYVKDSQTNKSSKIINLLKQNGFKVKVKKKNSLVSRIFLRSGSEPFRLLVFADKL